MTPAILALVFAAITGAVYSWSGQAGGIAVMVVAFGAFLVGWWERARWAR